MIDSLNNQPQLNQNNTEPQDFSHPLNSHFYQSPSVKANGNLSAIDFDKELQLKTNQILTLESQNQNYKQQIGILEKKNKFYESEYLTKTNELSNQIKDFTKQNSSSQIELSQKSKALLNQSNIISALDDENKYLKDQLSEMESNIIYLKQEVKKIIKEKENQTLQEKKAARYKQESELKGLIHTYSTEIAKLNQQIMSQQSELEITVDLNSKLQKEIEEKNNALSNYHNESIMLKSKLQEYEEYNSLLQRDKSELETSLTNLTHRNTKNEKAIYSYDNSVKELSSLVNSEIKLLSQWIETYMGVYYDRHFEVPSLQTNKTIESIQFDMLRNALEASRTKLNDELANYEQSINELKDEMHKGDMKNIQLKKELNEHKEAITDHKENELRYDNELEYYKKEIKESQDRISKLNHNETMKDKETNEYINKLLTIVKEEYDSIANDDNFTSFSEFISFSNFNIAKGDFGIKYQLEDILDKVMQILSELKFDYVKHKQQHLKNTSVSMEKKLNDTKESSLLQKTVNELEQEQSRQMVLISKIQSENLLLMNQIEILENTIKTKDMNENNLRIKHEKIKEENKHLAKKYNEISSQYDITLIEKKHIENQLNQSKILIQKGKQAENRILQLEYELEKRTINNALNQTNSNQEIINITDS